MKSFIKEIEDKFIELEKSDLFKKTNTDNTDE